MSMLLALAATQRGSEIRNLDTSFMTKKKSRTFFLLKQSQKHQNKAKDLQV